MSLTNQDHDYFGHARPEVCDQVDGQGLRVLDLGCAAGLLGEELLRRGTAREVHGIEIDAQVAAAASQRLQRVWVGDLDSFDLGQTDGPYDVVIAADVLEHLRDPWDALRRLHAVLVPGGRVVSSIPNLRYWKIVGDLVLRGRFDYTDEGILDRTHLRFFTRHTIPELFTSTGYSLDRLAPIPIERKGWKRALMSISGDFAHVQFNVVASQR